MELSQFEPFLVVVVGAAAVLSGLMFVGVSINLERVLQGPDVITARAAETLGTLVLAIVTGSLALLPQALPWLGVEVVALTLLLLVATTRSQVLHLRNHRDTPRSWLLTRSISTLSCCIPSLVGGVVLLLSNPNGVYGIAIAALLAISGCVYNAWVLLIEIAR